MTEKGDIRRLAKHPATPVDDFWVLKIMPFDFSQPVWWLIVTCLVYSVGFLAAILSSWPGAYVASPAFALGAAGVGWVWAVIAHRVRDAYVLYVNVGAVYETPEDEFKHFVSAEHREVLSWRKQLLMAGPIAGLLAAAAWIAFFRSPVTLFGQNIASLRPWPFQPEVYSSWQILPKFGVVAGFGVLIGLSIGITLWLMVREAKCIARMNKLTPVPLPEVVRGRLRPLADFHTRFATEWSMGVALFLILFWQTPDVASIGFLALLALIGLAAFILPQWLLSRLVRRSYERACAITLKAYEDQEMQSSSDSTGRVAAMASFRSATTPAKHGVYDIGGLILWLVSQVVAFTCVAIQVALTVKGS